MTEPKRKITVIGASAYNCDLSFWFGHGLDAFLSRVTLSASFAKRKELTSDEDCAASPDSRGLAGSRYSRSLYRDRECGV